MIPGLTKEDMFDVGRGATFMQKMKLLLWNAPVEECNGSYPESKKYKHWHLPDEAQLDKIGSELYDFVMKK